jgi:hypothetical protein
MESQAGNVNTVAAKARHRTASVTWTLDMENLKGSKGEESEDPHHTCCRQTQSNPKSRFDLDFECQVGERGGTSTNQPSFKGKSDLIWTLNAASWREVVVLIKLEGEVQSKKSDQFLKYQQSSHWRMMQVTCFATTYLASTSGQVVPIVSTRKNDAPSDYK